MRGRGLVGENERSQFPRILCMLPRILQRKIRMSSYPQLGRGWGDRMKMPSYPQFSRGTREINYPEFFPGSGEGRD